MSTPMDESSGWHMGPDGLLEPGYLPGTAWQPNSTGWGGHIDAWGSHHDCNLTICRACSLSADLHIGESS